ncbi:hypothetical protein QYE76_015278 [Lolium multiflorum]|uniref:F-box domain-containing protein n=1 Tax=Lolium multiflorum TaxID=4521 RepID=A0AAD8X6M2_LOLMU|nr:hypothetical protein QYE76_015278 [Lolium multiflorum]
MRMAPTEGRRRRDKVKSKAKKKKDANRRTTVHDLPEHILEQILLRLGPNSPSLLRAVVTCMRWCRVIADAGFLARLATTAPRHVGDYRNRAVECSFFVPSKPLEVNFRHFSLDFLPASESWDLSDSCGILLLLSKKFTCEEISHDYHCRCCPDLIVCDPLLARYQGIL